MNVHEPSRSAVGTSRARQTTEEDFHLAELLRSLRSLAADSPERQAKIEGLMHAYAAGELHVDADATASAMIDEALLATSRFR